MKTSNKAPSLKDQTDFGRSIAKLTRWQALPPEIIWLIFSYSDMATLARCSSVCSQWNLLIQPFWIEELSNFLEKMKNERENFKEIDVFYLVNCAQTKGSTTSILSQLHQQEVKREKYLGKLNTLEERQREVRESQQVFVMGVDPLGGCCVAYGNGHQSSFFGDIKRILNKSRYENNIHSAEKQEEKIVKRLEM